MRRLLSLFQNFILYWKIIAAHTQGSAYMFVIQFVMDSSIVSIQSYKTYIVRDITNVDFIKMTDDCLKEASVDSLPEPDGEIVDDSLQHQHHRHPLVVGVDACLPVDRLFTWCGLSADGAHTRVRGYLR